MSSDAQFAIGSQPCDKFTPQETERGSNRHQCIYCASGNGVVSFCLNCCRDHHEGGIENCEHVGCGCPVERRRVGAASAKEGK